MTGGAKLPEFPTSRFERRFMWTWLTTAPVLVVWGMTALKGGDQWPVAIAYMVLAIFIWTVPSAEQVVNMIKAAGVLKANPLDGLGWDAAPGARPPVQDGD